MGKPALTYLKLRQVLNGCEQGGKVPVPVLSDAASGLQEVGRLHRPHTTQVASVLPKVLVGVHGAIRDDVEAVGRRNVES